MIVIAPDTKGPVSSPPPCWTWTVAGRYPADSAVVAALARLYTQIHVIA